MLVPLLAAACGSGDAPADKVQQQAEAIVAPPPPEQAPVAKGRFAPRNECGKIAGANDFREAVIEAAQLRDADALAALTADDVRLDFGDGGGVAELRKRLADPQLHLWDELSELLALGCAPGDEGGIVMPWIFAQDTGGIDGYAALLVTGEEVSVLAAPAEDAKVLTHVSWDVVEDAGFDPKAKYQPVELADGTKGFIAADKLRSLLDYRLLASSRNGRWRITALVAGD